MIRAAAVSTSAAAGERGWSPAISRRGRALAGDRVEVDDRDDAVPVRVVLGEARGAEPAERAAVGGEEEQPVLGADDAGRGARRASRTPRASSISAAVPEALSFAPGAEARVVAVGHDDDRVGVLAARR